MLRCMYLVYVLYVEMYVSGLCSVCWDVCIWYMFCMLRCMCLVYVLYVEMYVSGICSVCWDVCIWYMLCMLRCMYLVYVLYVEMYVSGICSVCWDVWIWYICFNVYQIIDKEEKEGLFSFFSQHLQCSIIYCGKRVQAFYFTKGMNLFWLTTLYS